MRRSVLAVWFTITLFACDGVESTDALPMSQSAALPFGGVMFTSPSGISAAGREFGIDIGGATPGSRAAVFYSPGGTFGPGPCPGFMRGECLDITGGPNFFFVPDVDANGNIRVLTTLPRSVPSTNIAMQAVFYNPTNGRFRGTQPILHTVVDYAEDCAQPGAYEPNDEVVAAVSAGPATFFDDNTLCYGDRTDWFQIDLSAGESLFVDVEFVHAEGNIDLFVLDAPNSNHVARLEDAAVVQGTSFTDDENVNYTASASGTYYVAVRLRDDNGSSDGNSYNVAFNIAAP